MGRGDYLTVEVERTTHHDIIHQLRFGMPPCFSPTTMQTNKSRRHHLAYQRERLKITLRTDELPDWSRNGKLGVDPAI